MRHVFGPVPSRRLGRSLGVDPVPFKTCNWNCVYCQLGRTTPLCSWRKDFFPPEEIVGEVKRALDLHGPGKIDWVTFVASGETSLHAHLGLMIRRVKDMTDLPVAVITNGSLLYLPEVREELLLADAVLPSLDAGSEKVYRAINRPHPECSFDRLIAGLTQFRQDYQGQLWVEVMLVKGINDTPEALAGIEQMVKRIGRDDVQINTPVRPPAEPWVEPLDAEALARASTMLGDRSQVVSPAGASTDAPAGLDPANAVMDVILRHPMAEHQLVKVMGRWKSGEVHAALESLAAAGRAKPVERYGIQFWGCGDASYGEHKPGAKPAG